MKKTLYFCGVKLTVRYEAAAKSSVFCAPILLENYKRNEWGRSNRPKDLAQLVLTARTALSLLSLN